MGDITNGLNLGREGAFFWNMVEKLESFLYIDDTKETFDVVNMLLVGWVVLALLVYVFGNLIANHLQKRRDEASTDQEESADQEAKDHADSEKTVGKVADNDTAKIDSSVPIAAEPDVVKSTTGVLANGAQAIPRVKPLTLDKPVISALSRTDAILRRLSLPTATGTDPECVKWVNNVVHWLYTQEKQHVNPYVDSWLIALNEETQKASAEHGILVEIKRLQDGCSPPQLDDIRTELESNDNLTTLCNVEAEHMVFDVNVTRQLGNAADSTEYEVELEKLTGKLKVTCITEELLLVVRFAEQPTVKLKIKKKFSPEETETPQERALEVVILEIVSQAIGSAAVDLNFTAENDFPPYTKSSSVETLMPIHYDSLLSSATSPARHEQRLLVKVIKATNLGGERGCKEAYCVVEMDEPPQKFQTFPVKDTLSPFWDEHFWFNLQEGPAELLFEIYDKGTEKDTFLGLGIVSIEELLKSPSQRQIIPLQSRPMQNDDVSGSLTVEFLFMEGGVVTTKETTVNAATLEPVSVGKIIEKNQRVTPAGAVITTTTIQRVPVPAETDTGDTSESITDTALKEISKSGISSSASKSTLIIHSVQREAVRPPVKVRKGINGRWHEVTQENGVEGDSTSTTPPSSPASRPEHLSPADSMSSSTDDQDHARSRSKERKSLMGALKKRFSFSKSRSKSAEQRSTKDDTQSFTGSRSQSMERARSMPASRESSAPRTPGNNLLHVPGSGSKVDSNSTRSSMSELSGCSSSSARTFIHEKSTLVIEINENDVLKHYVIPASVAHKSKWRKRGVKLHIYNGHTFVAKHLSGSITCQVCKKLFPRRPGKQGYACRDCNFMTHKRCHIEVEAHCPKSTINSMEMQYINDPKAKSPAS